MFEMVGFAFIQVFLLILGAGAGAICFTVVLALTRQVAASRAKRVALILTALFPIVSVFYLEAGLVLHDFVQMALGRDSALNSLLHYPLANGYQLVFFDETGPDSGYIDRPNGGPLPLERIYAVQVAGDRVFVHAEAEKNRDPGTVPTVTITGRPPDPPLLRTDRFIEVDTRTSQIIDYASLEELRLAASRWGTQLQLTSSGEAYRKANSPAAAGWVFLVGLIAPLLAAGLWLIRKLQKLRRTAGSVAET